MAKENEKSEKAKEVRHEATEWIMLAAAVLGLVALM